MSGIRGSVIWLQLLSPIPLPILMRSFLDGGVLWRRTPRFILAGSLKIVLQSHTNSQVHLVPSLRSRWMQPSSQVWALHPQCSHPQVAGAEPSMASFLSPRPAQPTTQRSWNVNLLDTHIVPKRCCSLGIGLFPPPSSQRVSRTERRPAYDVGRAPSAFHNLTCLDNFFIIVSIPLVSREHSSGGLAGKTILSLTHGPTSSKMTTAVSLFKSFFCWNFWHCRNVPTIPSEVARGEHWKLTYKYIFYFKYRK